MTRSKIKVGRFLCIKVEIYKNFFVIANIYAPNNEKEHAEFFNGFNSILQEFNNEGHTCIIGGDFNLIQDLAMDREGGAMKTIWKHSCTLVDSLKDYFNLIDIWRVRKQTTKRFTWRRSGPPTQVSK